MNFILFSKGKKDFPKVRKISWTGCKPEFFLGRLYCGDS